ncbi:MAG: threonine/serine exporter family protein [Candidatus Eisenbacteria bacterium]|uniref:Threonine/serine exporter family protein n=1 Tax=Eiseniibacteriota bacterium TaxID=2212470 RepID=A0A849SJM7_UNCEI|nr:threonine/serine exporter family protein [Candidatus Eisenbacteria bacterium]
MNPTTERVGFVLHLGRALHAYGTPAHRLEETLARVAERLGVPGQFFATPTSLIAAFGPIEEQRTHLLRLDPGETDLERMAVIDRIGGEVLAGRLSPEQGSARIEAAQAAPGRYPVALEVLAFGLSSAAAARFLGGGGAEVAVAGVIGLVTGTLQASVARVPGIKRVFAPLAAAIAAAIATAASRPLGGLAISTAMLGGILVLVPGLTLTVAMAELSARHLVAGTARLAGALGTFLGIAFGVAIGARVAAAAFGAPLAHDPIALPPWTELLALAVAPLTFTVLLRAHPRAIPNILVVGALAFFAGRTGARLLGPELGIFTAALVAAGASNLIARRINRPASITLVPALLLIVPGSVGFRSLASLLDRATVDGVETAFRMTLMLAALVTGLFAAQILAPARRWSE